MASSCTRAKCALVGVIAAAAAMTVPARARAEPRDAYASFGVDTAGMGAWRGDRGDLSYFFLMTPRAHFGLGDHLGLSVGLGLPLAQLLAVGGAKGNRGAVKEAATFGLGVNTPVELRLSPGGRDAGGIMFIAGASPLLSTAVTCALEGQCTGKKSLALVYGYTVQGGVGYQWKDGSFVQGSYALGHLWPGGHKNGEPAIDGLYRGGWLSFGIAFK